MTLRRIEATVEITRHSVTQAGNVFRSYTRRVDLTTAVYNLPLAVLRSLQDDGVIAVKMARKHTLPNETIRSVSIVTSLKRSIGVSRLSEITEEDLHAARIMCGIINVRKRAYESAS